MKEKFREYHKFSDAGIKQLWKEGLFVFDTNTLLNMYRYSRDTVDDYIKVLAELKKKEQIWIPYQVGYEFYENRINVINEYKKSYDAIQDTLDKAKQDIESKYKDHPFLNLSEIKDEITKGLSSVEKKIKQAKKDHPNWLKKDDVLDKINSLFDDATGDPYPPEEMQKLFKDGEDRYKEKRPPGYKDAKKLDNKYGDYILWCQIIDKAKETKKPIIFISGDVKEDWWLESDGEKIMPLPGLKKEMLEKAGVDFHIYTADRFLEFYKEGKTSAVDEDTIKEVRKIRKLEEERSLATRYRNALEIDKETTYGGARLREKRMEMAYVLDAMHDVMVIIRTNKVHPGLQEDLSRIFFEINEFNSRVEHGKIGRFGFEKLVMLSREFVYLIEKAVHSEDLDDDANDSLRKSLSRIMHSVNKLNHRY